MYELQRVQFFLGANSPQGFYSLYDELLDPAEAAQIIILKGGPGCGKSTLMRRLSASAAAQGLPVHEVLCSGDPASLDAVLFPSLKVAVVDGTAPHVVEPKFPGLVEHYLNMEQCYDAAGLGDVRAEILGCMAGYGDVYQRAYRYLSAAATLRSEQRALLETPELTEKMQKRARGILARECKKDGVQTGRIQRRFLSAITHAGTLCCFETATALCTRVYELSDSTGLAHTMLSALCEGITARGYDVIACPSPACPERLAHLLVPALSLAFVSTTAQQPYLQKPYRRIRLDAMPDPALLRRNKARLHFSKRVSAALQDEAIAALAEAKGMHDQLEAIYHPYVDFEKVQQMGDAVLASLFARQTAKEPTNARNSIGE